MKQFLFLLLFGAEYHELREARAELRRLKPAPARFVAGVDMTEAQIADRLAGTENAPPVKAIMSKIGSKVIELSDRATDAPRSELVTRDGIVPAFTADERLHLAGGAAHLAELLRDLESLTKPRKVETPSEAATA